MVYTSLDQTTLDYEEPLYALNAAKKLNEMDVSKIKEKKDHYPIYRAPMELKISFNQIRLFSEYIGSIPLFNFD